jgi:hypothetical protein
MGSVPPRVGSCCCCVRKGGRLSREGKGGGGVCHDKLGRGRDGAQRCCCGGCSFVVGAVMLMLRSRRGLLRVCEGRARPTICARRRPAADFDPPSTSPAAAASSFSPRARARSPSTHTQTIAPPPQHPSSQHRLIHRVELCPNERAHTSQPPLVPAPLPPIRPRPTHTHTAPPTHAQPIAP